MVIELLSYSLVKDVALLTWRAVRGRPRMPELPPEQPATRSVTVARLDRPLVIPLGYAGAVVDHALVQCRLGPGAYRRSQLRRLRRRHALSSGATIVLWPAGELALTCQLDRLFTADNHEFEARLRLRARVRPESATQAIAGQTSMAGGWGAAEVASLVHPIVQASLGERTGGGTVAEESLPARLADQLREPLTRYLATRGLDLVAVDELSLSNEVLASVRQNRARSAEDEARLVAEAERDRVRGLMRQMEHDRRLGEVRDGAAFDQAVRLVQRDTALREKALARELDEAEVANLLAKVVSWERAQEAIARALDGSLRRRADQARSAHALAAELSRQFDGGETGGLSAHQQQQVARCLADLAAAPNSPEETLAAIQRGLDIPPDSFDPLRSLYGAQTLRVGDQWRLWDGETLWHLSMTSIRMRRAGFMWLRERPHEAVFEMRGTPGERRVRQSVCLRGGGALEVGGRRASVRFVSGNRSQVTVALERQAAGGVARA